MAQCNGCEFELNSMENRTWWLTYRDKIITEIGETKAQHLFYFTNYMTFFPSRPTSYCVFNSNLNRFELFRFKTPQTNEKKQIQKTKPKLKTDTMTSGQNR